MKRKISKREKDRREKQSWKSKGGHFQGGQKFTPVNSGRVKGYKIEEIE